MIGPVIFGTENAVLDSNGNVVGNGVASSTPLASGTFPFGPSLVVQCECKVSYYPFTQVTNGPVPPTLPSNLTTPCQVTLLLSSDAGKTYVRAETKTFRLFEDSHVSFRLGDYADRKWLTTDYTDSTGKPLAVGLSTPKAFHPQYDSCLLLFFGNTPNAVTVAAAVYGGY